MKLFEPPQQNHLVLLPFPGPGLGGHCIPIDPFYLSWKAKEFGMNLKFIELAGSKCINAKLCN